jgi:hypothetical protein
VRRASLETREAAAGQHLGAARGESTASAAPSIHRKPAMPNPMPIRLLVATAMLAVASTAQAFLIDDFSDNQIVIADSNTQSSDLASGPTTSFIGTNSRQHADDDHDQQQ